MLFLILLICVCLIVAATLAVECWKVYITLTKLRGFCGLYGLPVLGKVIDLLKCDTENVFDLPAKLIGDVVSKVYYAWFGPVLFVFTSSPEVYETILNSEKCVKKAYIYSFLRNTTGIFTAEPNTWKAHRRALNPTLGPQMVNTFLSIFNEKSQKMIDLMEANVGENVDMHRFAFKASLDSILSSSFDINWSLQNQRGDKLRDVILNIFERVQLRAQSIWMKWDPIYRFTNYYQIDNREYPKFHRVIDGILEAKKVDLAESLAHGDNVLAKAKESNRLNFLQKCLLLYSEKKFNDLNVRDEMQTILIGSVDTTASASSIITLMLAIHQDYQDRVVEELRTIFTDADEPVTAEHLSKMTYTELVIKESLRLLPIIVFIARECTDDLPMHGGIVPKGATIIIDFFKSNRDPLLWGENVNEFYPERFLPENSANFHPYQFIPFSAGARNCIGIRYAWASMKISMAYLLRKYKFTTDLKMHEVRYKTGLILKIVNEDPVRIERREW